MNAAADTADNTVAVLLAAGAGSRFHGGVHKLLAPLHGLPVYRWALDCVSSSGLSPIVVVTGAAALELPADVVEVHNPRWMEGQMTSLRAGIAAADRVGATAVVIGLGDQPFLTPTAWQAIAAHPSPIAVATYAGRRGHPVRLGREVWPLLDEGEQGDQGARSLMRRVPHLVVEVACDGSPADIDTVEDLRQWNS